MKILFARTFAVALVLALTATGLWAAGAVEEPAAAADKTYVTDPTTGKVVVAPQYGGTITFVDNGSAGTVTDYYVSGAAPKNVQLFMEKLGIANWAIDRDVWPFNTQHIPDFALSGRLAKAGSNPTWTLLSSRSGRAFTGMTSHR